MTKAKKLQLQQLAEFKAAIFASAKDKGLITLTENGYEIRNFTLSTNGYECEITVTRKEDGRVMLNYIATQCSNLDEVKQFFLCRDLEDRMNIHPVTGRIINKGYLTSNLYDVVFESRPAGSYVKDQHEITAYLNSIDLGETGGRNWVLNGLIAKGRD